MARAGHALPTTYQYVGSATVGLNSAVRGLPRCLSARRRRVSGRRRSASTRRRISSPDQHRIEVTWRSASAVSCSGCAVAAPDGRAHVQPRRDIARMAIPPRDPHRRLRLPGRAVHSCPNSGPTAGHTYVALVQIPGDPAWWPLGTVVAPTCSDAHSRATPSSGRATWRGTPDHRTATCRPNAVWAARWWGRPGCRIPPWPRSYGLVDGDAWPTAGVVDGRTAQSAAPSAPCGADTARIPSSPGR